LRLLWELEHRARASGRVRGQLEDAAETAGDAAAERQPETASRCVGSDLSKTDAVVVDRQPPRARRLDRRHVNVVGTSGNGVRKQISQDHAERFGWERQRRLQVGRDLDLGADILDRLVEALGGRDEDPLTRFAQCGLEQRLDAVQRILDVPRRIVGEERRVERSLQLVCNECREVLERLVAPSEVDRGSCETLFGRTPPDDRRSGRQRGRELRPDPAAMQNEGTRTPERQIVTAPAGNSDCSAGLRRAVVRRPPLDPSRSGAAIDRLDDLNHRRREIVGRRERKHDVVLEYLTLVVKVPNGKFDDVRSGGHGLGPFGVDYAARRLSS
jgi:hypothetical protein